VNTDRRAVVSEIESLVESKLTLLRPVETCWQPTDFVPAMSGDNWMAELKEFRETAKGICDELLVVLVGTMVTEEALPSYQTFLNRLDGIGDTTGTSDRPWAQWSRGWTAEENRHGDLLNRYLYLTGRVDMRSVEVTIQHLIRNGFNPREECDAYSGMVYTSFQERATRISHSRIGQLARQAGDENLSKMCNVIAGDEARHEEAYKSFAARICEMDPAGFLTAFHNLLNQRIVMPAELMSDGSDNDVFAYFSKLAQRLGVYTIADYVDILEHLLSTWNVPSLGGLSGAAAKAQDRLCRLPDIYRRRIGATTKACAEHSPMQFRWIHNRSL
jgi:acyl-[acyl-carrier-protein] desaturase